MFKHILTIALILMGAFIMWVRTYASPTSNASSARTVLLVLAVGFLSAAILNHRSENEVCESCYGHGEQSGCPHCGKFLTGKE